MPLAALRPFTGTTTPALTSASIRIPARARRVLTGLPVTTATAIACALVNVAGWRGQDFPAAVLRISVFRQGGWFWNPQWFGGHPTLGYSVLFPVLGALTSAATLGLLATTGAVAGFEVFVRDRPRATLATSAFAFGMISNFVVGRIPFALGCALAMACIATLGSSRIAAACLAVLASLSSPIAALFLVIVLAGWIAAKRAYAFGALLVVAALGPALVLSVFLGTGGDFPFPFWSLVWCLALCALVASVFATAPVRVSCAVYALVCLGAFAVASPLGGNLSRMPLLVAGPLVLLADPIRVWRVLLVVPVVVGWQAIEIAEVANATIADASTTRDYYDGVLRFFDGVPGPVRVEIPATSQHWEAAYVGASVALARGWERQLDRRLNPEFYDREHPLDASRYEAWLSQNGVSYVALPDTAFDPSSKAEARLVRSGLDYLTPVYRDAHWTVYRMDGAQDLLDGPGRLIAVDGRRIVFDARHTGPFVVRVRSSAAWQVATGNACTGAGRDDWLTVDVVTPGRIVLTQRVDWLTLLEDDADRSCHEDRQVAIPTSGHFLERGNQVTDSRPSWIPDRFSASID